MGMARECNPKRRFVTVLPDPPFLVTTANNVRLICDSYPKTGELSSITATADHLGSNYIVNS
jgi:hypothetical protein